jgi:predicted nucleic acid-binding protein
MSGTKYLVDTNFIIHLTQEKYWVEPFLDAKIIVSFITEMELLGVFSISKSHKANMQSLLNDCQIIELNQIIKYLAIDLKQKYKLKLADAIIAATAIHLELPFITSDSDFKLIKELELIFLEK